MSCDELDENGMKVGIRYCGGCNPRYDRTAEVRKLMTGIPDVTFTYDAAAFCNIWLLVCGCPSACVSDEGLQGDEMIRISGRKHFAMAASRICAVLEVKAHEMPNVPETNACEMPELPPDRSGHVKTPAAKRELRVGDTAFLEKAFSEEEIRTFAKLSMDDNPVHLDPEFAAKGLFRRPVVHGVLAAGLLSSVMGTKLPGPGTVLMEEQVHFLHPVYPGEKIRAEITFSDYQEERRFYTGEFAGKLLNEDGVVLAEGTFRQMMLKKLFHVCTDAGR